MSEIWPYLWGCPQYEYFYTRSAQPFWAKGCSVLFLLHSRAKDKIMILTFESQLSKAEKFI